MSRYLRNTLAVAIAVGALNISLPAGAGVACGPGLENVAGTCMTAGLAASMRERGVLMNQLKIGYNLPIAPKKDNLYPRNFDVNRFEFSQPGNFSTNPFPPSP